MVTLKDIREYMVNSMSHYDPSNDEDYDGEDYDEDGHCGDGLWLSIQEFWDDFKTDADFRYLVSCEWLSDDFDLEGGRSYLLDSKLVDMCFDYMYKTLGWSKSDYQNIIHNTVSFGEDLEYKYDNISVQRDEKINSIIEPEKKVKTKCVRCGNDYVGYDNTNNRNYCYSCSNKPVNTQNTIVGKRNALENPHWLPSIKFDNQSENCDFDYIPHVIRYHKSKEKELETFDSIEYLGKSRVDDNFIIYKIKSLGVKIPKGYEVVKSVNEIMSN